MSIPDDRTSCGANATRCRSATRVNFSYLGPQFTYLAYSPISDRLEGRGLLSALITLRKDAWQVELYGTNLTNKDYVSGQFGTNEFYGLPREYGVRASLNF